MVYIEISFLMLFLFQLHFSCKSQFKIEKNEFTDHSDNCNRNFQCEENIQN